MISLLISYLITTCFAFTISPENSYVLSLTNDDSSYDVAQLTFQHDKWVATSTDLQVPSNTYCLSIKDHSKMIQPCFNYFDVSQRLNGSLILEQSGDDVNAVTFLPSVGSGKIHINIIYNPTKELPKPVKESTKPINPMLPKKDEDKSFLQKYWMYILPLGIVLLAPQ